MRILITWGSRRGGTAGIGRILGEALTAVGHEVVTAPVEQVQELAGFGAVIIGGALYANRWAASARRFVARHIKHLREVPVWLFSSGPLDDSADRWDIPPPTQVAVLAERIGAQGHVTFGGRLEPDAKGFPASAMARSHSGDWRNPERVRAWAATIATALPGAAPRMPIEPPARSVPRLLTHALAGWAVPAATLAILFPLVGLTAALVVRALLAPLWLVAVAWHYFRARGARAALPTAAVWTALAALPDLALVAVATQHQATVKGLVCTGASLAFGFLGSWAVGALMATLPWPKPAGHGDAGLAAAR